MMLTEDFIDRLSGRFTKNLRVPFSRVALRRAKMGLDAPWDESRGYQRISPREK